MTKQAEEILAKSRDSLKALSQEKVKAGLDLHTALAAAQQQIEWDLTQARDGGDEASGEALAELLLRVGSDPTGSDPAARAKRLLDIPEWIAGKNVRGADAVSTLESKATKEGSAKPAAPSQPPRFQAGAAADALL